MFPLFLPISGNKLKELEEENSNLRTQVANKAAAAHSLAAQQAELDRTAAEMVALRDKLSDCQTKLKPALAGLAQCEATVKETETKAAAKAADYEKRIRDSAAEAVVLKEKLDNTTKALTDCQTQLQPTLAGLAKTEAAAKDIEAKAAEKSAEYEKRLQETLSQMQNDRKYGEEILGKWRAYTDKLRSDYDELVAKTKKLVPKYNTLVTDYDDVVDKYEALQAEHDKLQAEHKALQGNCKTEEKVDDVFIAEFETQVKNATDRFHMLETENKQLSAKIHLLESTLKQHTPAQMLREINAKFGEFGRQNDKLLSDNMHLQRELTQKTRELERLQQKRSSQSRASGMKSRTSRKITTRCHKRAIERSRKLVTLAL